jgi:L-fuculose-phosphate aldolase
VTNEPTSAISNAKDWLAQREAVLDGAHAMAREGLVAGTSGNVSVRCGPDLLAITATSVRYDAMTLDDVVVVDFEGDPVVGDALPSSETLLHAAVYRARPGVGAVMHTHSIYASALAVAGKPVPPMIDEMVIHIGGTVEVSEYAFPGTEELGEAVVQALGERTAALIRNHGMVGVGGTALEALAICQMVERAAQIYAVAQSVGGARELPSDVVETERELFRMRQTAKGDIQGGAA